MSFFDKLEGAIENNKSILVVGLDPNPEMLPQHYQEAKNSVELMAELWDWLEFLIEETVDHVCAYKPDLGFYQALGSAGLDLLTRALAKIPEYMPIILDAKHGDLNTSSILAHTAFEEWGVDGLTLNPYAGQDISAPFLVYPDKALFVLCRTSNPAAAIIQEYPNIQSPLYLKIVEEVKNWGTPEQVCLEVGTTSPEVMQKIRAKATERLILARSLWEREDNLESILRAGLNEEGRGLLIPIPQNLLSEKNAIAPIDTLNAKINSIRESVEQTTSYCDLWVSDVCLLQPHPHQELILQLYDLGCILFGEYVQASGATFSYYIDLRKIISQPQVFHQVLNAYAEILEGLKFDRIAGIPYGSLPTATGLSLRLHHPMIFPRKEVKAHGTRRAIEGNFHPGETVAVVDDILITGKSVMEGAEKLKGAGLVVEDIVVFIDHGEGVKERLGANGYRAHSVLSLSDITNTLYQAGRINEEKYRILLKN